MAQHKNLKFNVKPALIITCFFLMTIFLVGCGKTPLQDDESPADEELYDWKQNGFAAPGDLQTEQTLWAGKFLPITHTADSPDADSEKMHCMDRGVCGKLLWHLYAKEYAKGADATYYVETLNAETGESLIKSFKPADLGLSGELGVLEQMNMPDESRYVFRWLDYEQDAQGLYSQTQDKIIYTDFAGNTKSTDFWEIYLENGIVNVSEPTSLPLVQVIDWFCAKDGAICITSLSDSGSFSIYLFDEDGGLLSRQDLKSNQSIAAHFCTPDGELIFAVYDNSAKCYDFLFFDTEEKKMRSLLKTDVSYGEFDQIYGMQGNEIYYLSKAPDENGIMKWNIKSGRRELILNLNEAEIGNSFETLFIPVKDKMPMLYLSRYEDGSTREWMMTLSSEKSEDDGTVRVANFSGSGDSLGLFMTCADETSVSEPAYSYQYEDDSQGDGRERILAELSGGDGPEIVLVSYKDLHALADKGVLMELDDLLTPEIREKLLPAALEIGTIDGKLFGIPPTVAAETIAAGADVWQNDTWTLEDITELMEQGNLPCALRSNLPDLTYGSYMPPVETVGNLLKYSLNAPELIDFESGTCHFDDEKFVRLIELCSSDKSQDATKNDGWQNGGGDILWGYFTGEKALFEMFEYLEANGGKIYGFPTDKSCGNYLSPSGGVLAVTSNADHQAASAFIKTLLSKKIQSGPKAFSMSVLKPVQEDYVIEDSGILLYRFGDGSAGERMPVFADGSNPYKRAEEFLLGCKGAPYIDTQFTSILYEELKVMYESGRSAKETAQIINKRIQLILDERSS